MRVTGTHYTYIPYVRVSKMYPYIRAVFTGSAYRPLTRDHAVLPATHTFIHIPVPNES